MSSYKTTHDLQSWLQDHGIDTTTWGKGNSKDVLALWRELVEGETKLEDTPPRRVVRVVQVIIKREEMILVEAKQEMGDGRVRIRNLLPSEKMKPEESPQDAAHRCLDEELGIASDQAKILPDHQERREEQESPSYPGLTTRYYFFEVEAIVTGLPVTDFWRDNATYQHGDPVKRHHWDWVPVNRKR